MGWWTRKQIVGHLLNSAANNRQRFVRAAIDGRYTGPQYAHDDWVAAHGYENLSWETLIRWWLAENQILMAVVLRIPDSRLDARCKVGDKPAVTLGFLIEEYLSHQQRHIQALVAT
jgi:hypothetical protein